MFVVVIAPALPDHVRGYLSRFFVEPNPNVFVGVCSRNVAENLWERITDLGTVDNFTMIQSASGREHEQGYHLRVYGEQAPCIVDLDGLELIARVEPVNGTQGVVV